MVMLMIMLMVMVMIMAIIIIIIIIIIMAGLGGPGRNKLWNMNLSTLLHLGKANVRFHDLCPPTK